MARIVKRRNKWYSDFQVNGKHVHVPLSTDEREAWRKLKEMVALKTAEKRGEIPQDMSWEFFQKRYLQYCKANKVANSFYQDERAFRYLNESLPIYKITQCTPEYLDRLKTLWEKEGKTLSVVTRCVKAIKAALRKAEDWKFVNQQNWRTVMVKEPKGRLTFFTIEELRDLLKSCRGPWKTSALLMSRSGLRSGEVYWLEWKDILFERNLIHITGKPGWQPKGGKSRHVPMSYEVKQHLESIARPEGFVLSAERPTVGSFHTYFREIIKDAGLKGSPHKLRHTFASHLVMAGVPLKTVSVLLGHSGIRMTEIYSHLSPETLEAGIERLPEL